MDGPFDKSRDVGDIALLKLGALALTVRDERGLPIAGAVCGLARGRKRLGPLTNQDGEADIAVPPEAKVLAVGAIGYRPGAITLPVVSGRASVTLVASKTARVFVVDPSGKPMPGALVVVTADTSPFVSGLFGDPVLVLAGGSRLQSQSSHGSKGVVLRFLADDEGRVVLANVRDDVVMTASARDPSGFQAVQREFSIGARREAEVTLKVSRAPRALRGRVVDRDGRPIVKGVARLLDGKGNRSYTYTSLEGRFSFEGLLADRVRLRVSASGFSPVVKEVLVTDGQEIRLDPGHRLLVTAEDERGRRVRIKWMKAELAGGGPSPGARRTPDGFELRDLPVGDVTVDVRLPSGGYEGRGRTTDGKLVVRVPVHGAVAVRIAESLRAADHWLVLKPEKGGRDQRFELVRDAPDPVTFEAVLPGRWIATVVAGEAETRLAGPTPVVVRPAESTEIVIDGGR